MEKFDYTAMDFWWNLIQTTVLVLFAVYTWLVNRTKVNREAIDEVEKSMSSIEQRVAVIENDLVTVNKTSERLDQLGAAIKHMEGSVQQMNQTLHMIQQYLLEKS